MPPDASLIIPYENGASRRPRALLDDVQQIVKQKGAFRHVTETKLNLQSAGIVDNDDDESDNISDTEPETTQETQKRLFATRNELTRLYQ